MSDLISRSELIEKLWQKHKEVEDKCYCYTDADEIKEIICGIVSMIDEQPTAFDVGKVVEELKKIEIGGDCRKNCEYYDWSVGACEGHCEDYVRGKAIEIVKQGGDVTETKTIRDKATEWNNHSSKKVPYEFIDFVEGKREIAKDDDVCEWNGERSRLVTFTRFTTNCGDNIDLQTNSELLKAFRYCPFCGKKIKIVGD